MASLSWFPLYRPPRKSSSTSSSPRTEVVLIDGVPMVIEAVTPPGRGQVDVRVFNQVSGGEIPARVAFRFTYEGGIEFVRGDSNSDGKLDISDAVRLLERLFLGKGSVGCEDAGPHVTQFRDNE